MADVRVGTQTPKYTNGAIGNNNTNINIGAIPQSLAMPPALLLLQTLVTKQRVNQIQFVCDNLILSETETEGRFNNIGISFYALYDMFYGQGKHVGRTNDNYGLNALLIGISNTYQLNIKISYNIDYAQAPFEITFPELTPAPEPEPEPEPEIEPNISKIILTMQRTAETTDNAIGATAFKFIDTNQNIFEAEPSISGNSGTLTFIHDSEYFIGNVTLNLADKSDEFNKNYIFQDIEGKSWISTSVATGQKVQLVIEFEEGAPNIFSGIQLLNGKAILGAEGQDNLESWFQKANLLIIDENNKIVVNQNYDFGNIGMTLEAEIPPINPPVEPEPEPEDKINEIERFRLAAIPWGKGQTATQGYVAFGEYRLIDKEGNKLIPMINARYSYSTNPFTLEYKGKQYTGNFMRYNLNDYQNSTNYTINRIVADLAPDCGSPGGWASNLTNKTNNQTPNGVYNMDLVFDNGTPEDIIGFELIPFRSSVGYSCTAVKGDLQLLDKEGNILNQTTIADSGLNVVPISVKLGQDKQMTTKD